MRRTLSVLPLAFGSNLLMQQYKMAFLDKLNVVVTVRDFEGANDTAALAHAYSLCKTHTIEVTQAGRRIGEAEKGAFFGVHPA
jgi:hypothetical protein